MGGNDHVPKAYSTQLGGNYDSGYKADGYSVVIDPDKLQSSINTYRGQLHGQNPTQMVDTIMNALIAEDAFGALPNATAAYAEVQNFVTQHAAAMQRMGVSLADFVATVQAAADLGYEADPVTKQQAARAAHNFRTAI